MRILWWSALALLLCLAVTSALRTQADGTSRVNRRFPNSNRNPISVNQTEEVSSTSRVQTSRRRVENTFRSKPSGNLSRTRNRNKPNETSSSLTNPSEPQAERTEQFDSKKSNSRIRNRRPVIDEANFDTTLTRERVKSRSRQTSRYSTPQPVQPTQTLVQTPSSLEASATTPIDFIYSDKPSKAVKEVAGNQFKRRGTTVRTVEATPASRVRGRINTRTDIKPLDLEVSGTANALTTAPKDPTTARSGDIRNSRKLKYRSRQSETDTNLTGEGIISNERKSSPTREHTSSQPVLKKVSRLSTENIVEQNTEKNAAGTAKVIKRPVTRRKLKSVVKVEKSKVSDEVSEDDNYPESFKALIQAKNASTHTSSPSGESLSVKASQKVFQTLTTTPQSFLTTPDVEKQTPLRKKNNAEDVKNSTESDTVVIVEPAATASEDSIVKPAEYRLRGTYTPRITTITASSFPVIETSTLSPSTLRSYKFSRKAKLITTVRPFVENALKPKRLETNLYYKKPVIRSSFYPKRNSTRNFNVNSGIPKITTTERNNNDGIKTFNNSYKSRQILPRTSYYSRKTSSTVNVISTTELSAKDENEVLFADKKMEDTVEVPLIYTSLNRPLNTSVDINSLNRQHDTNYAQQPFLIKVTSKESSENGTENEIINKSEENENERESSIVTTTQKYHATYKDNNNVYVDENKKNGVSTLEPPIRNIQTRKFNRKPAKQKEEYSIVTPKYRERNLRKYSDTFSKTTEASSNGIIAEGDKPKTKFSSKYRASYLDKPFYRPTVPTVTTSTAWLKFFVTDHLTKAIEEPNWLDEEDLLNVTTQPMPRQNTTSPNCLHDSSFQPVEGEEIQLGLDMNAISFTKTRSPLTSADLKLSESLARPLQVMNVEASHHSPSVTVSIFDALAEILTSTPRPRISSTTEVQLNQNSNSDVKQTFDAVSSNTNVNSVKDLTSQDTVLSKDNVNTIAQSVQITEQTTPNVSNRMSLGGTITPSLNIEDKKTFPDTTSEMLPFTTPFPLSTTPLSARRPFAIKVLYAETEPPRDRTTTFSTLNMAMTDSPKMVHNTVSDLILSNNKLVSSELTGMLSNNIKNIIQNMDNDSKARLSVEMVKLLNSLIPKLQKPITSENDGDLLPNTTPYSLEDIKDTENIVIDGNEVLIISNTNIVQNVDNSTIVNSTFGNVSVNSSSSMEDIGSTASTLGVQTTISNNAQPTEANLLNFETPIIESTTLSTLILESLNNAPSVDVFRNNDNTLNLNRKFTNNNTLVPFLTNFELNDFMSIPDITDSNNSPTSSSNVSESPLNTTSVPISSLQIRELEDIDKIEDPSQLSRLQLWILSKKARVLKMIEDLIRNHNDEIANAPLAELFGDSKDNNLSFSNRLNEIVNTMTTTTRNSDITNELISTVMTNIPETTTLTPQISLPTQSTITFMTTGSSENMANFLTTTESLFDGAISKLGETEQPTTSASDLDTNFLSTLSTTNEVSTTLKAQETDTTILNVVDETTSNNSGENSTDEDSVTESSLTTVKNLESTPGSTKNCSSSQIDNLSNKFNIPTTVSTPKKDYVIFGILPNNTVVRKDPNDNVLESLTEASPYIIYGVLPNNTIIRKFPNGTRIPRIMQKIDILPISPWSLRNPYSPIHNIPAIVRPQSNPIRVSTNTVTSTDTSNNGSENRLTNDTVNNQQITMSSSALNINDSSSLGITTTNMPPAVKSTASHVLSLRTTTMLPSVDEILLNSISSATKEEMVISSMTSSTSEPRILTLDIDPETKQIRTEKPGDINGNTIFKFIPIDQVTMSEQESNVLKLASTKMPITLTTDTQTSTIPSVTEFTTQSQVQNSVTNEDLTSTIQATTEILDEPNKSEISELVSRYLGSTILPSIMTTPDEIQITTEKATTVTSTLMTTNPTTVTADPVTIPNIAPITTTQAITSTQMSTNSPFTVKTPFIKHSLETASSNQNEAELLQSLLREIGRSPKNLNSFGTSNRLTKVSSQNNNDQLLQSILAAGALNSKNLMSKVQTTTLRSIEDEIRQFEEDSKLLKALLQATGRNPNELNLPTIDDIKKITGVGIVTTPPTTTTRITTTMTPTTTFRTTTTTTRRPTTTIQPTTISINEDIRKLQEDTKLLQALLQATGNKNNVNLPVVSGITSNVRIASNPFTTTLESNPTTPVNIRPVYTTRPLPIITTLMPGTVTVSTLQPQQQSGDEFGISTTFRPINERSTTTIRSIGDRSTTSRNSKSLQFPVTTEMPSTSTFSDEEDLLFLQNLKSVLSTKTGDVDPETALANRVIALAVEKSLNEIQTGKVTTTKRPVTTTRTTTTTRRITTTADPSTPSIEDDIKQFEQDTKLLQALLKATGQDPSKLNIPTLPPSIRPVAGIDSSKSSNPTTVKPYGAKIAVKDDLKNEQDDAQLLQTLIKLQDAQETTTQRSKIALTGQSSDEALKKLLQQAQPTGMISEATKSSVSLSTEYGNSNDALLAALLKEQGFGPTTASSLDEQLRLAALLNQVVVTPKARRTTTRPPPPPPPPRRPVLDGLAWLWQQWRETGPGPGGARPNRRPAPSERPSSSAETSSRVNWFGSGPFVGNADEKPSSTSNRIPLEPPSAITEQGPGRGQLVSAAINVTRAFSQFLGAAIQGAAQTVQNVFRYGQRAAADTANGSG